MTWCSFHLPVSGMVCSPLEPCDLVFIPLTSFWDGVEPSGALQAGVHATYQFLGWCVALRSPASWCSCHLPVSGMVCSPEEPCKLVFMPLTSSWDGVEPCEQVFISLTSSWDGVEPCEQVFISLTSSWDGVEPCEQVFISLTSSWDGVEPCEQVFISLTSSWDGVEPCDQVFISLTRSWDGV